MVVGALVTFGILLVSSNRLMMSNTQVAEQNEYYITAMSLGKSVIDEAKTKYFDEKIDSVRYVSFPDSLSATLGRDGAGETVPSPDTASTAAPFSAASPGFASTLKFDDVDDYNGYSRLVNTPRAEGYSIRAKVLYASATKPDSASVAKTYCKVMYVSVTSPFLARVELRPGEAGYVANAGKTRPDTVKLTFAFTY